MAIAYVGGQVAGRSNPTNAISVDFALTGGLASVPAAGDLVIVTAVTGSAAGNPAMAVTTPTGYTALGQLNQSAVTADTSMDVSYKIMTATPDTSVTIPGTTSNLWGEAYAIQVFRGVDPTTPMDVAAVAGGATGTGRPNPEAINFLDPGAAVVICGGGAAGTGANYTAPANYETNFLTTFGADNTDAIVGCGYNLSPSNPEDPAVYTGGTTGANDSWCSYTLALRPLAAAVQLGSALALAATALALATSISMVGFAMPSKAAGVVPGATLTSTVPLTGSSIETSRAYSPPPNLQLAPSPSRAAGVVSGATLDMLSSIFDLGTATSRASGLAPPANLNTLFPLDAVPARAHARGLAELSTHFPTTDIGGAISRDSSRSTSRLTVVNYATPSRTTGRVHATLNAMNFDLGGAISLASGRLRATGIRAVHFSAPSRALARAGPATVRFVGAGFDMGMVISRETGRLRVTGIRLVSYASPIRTGGYRSWGPPSLFYIIGPTRDVGYARTAQSLIMQGQFTTTYSRATGRVVSAFLHTISAAVPSRAHPLAVAVLQFSGGTLIAIEGCSRATSRLHGLQLQMAGGQTIGISGRVRAEGRLSGATLNQYYYVTPVKADPRVLNVIRLHMHHETGPSRGTVLRAYGELTASLKQQVQGFSRTSSRLSGAFLTIKPQLTGTSLGSSPRLLGQLASDVDLLAAPSREVALVYAGVMQFAPEVIVQHAATPSRSTGRLLGDLHSYQAAQPILATARVTGATLTSTLPLAGSIRAQSVAVSALGMTGPTVKGIDGTIRASARLIGSIRTFNAGGWILSGSGRVRAATPSFALALRSVSHAHPRAVAILAFTGATLQPVSGRLSAHSRAFSDLRMTFAAQPSQVSARLYAQLLTIHALAGTSRAEAILLGAFANPYAQAISRNVCLVQPSTFISTLQLNAGTSLGTGRLIGNLTLPAEIPARIFMAKDRVFVFAAQDRYFVIHAKDRRFIFTAGGPGGIL